MKKADIHSSLREKGVNLEENESLILFASPNFGSISEENCRKPFNKAFIGEKGQKPLDYNCYVQKRTNIYHLNNKGNNYDCHNELACSLFAIKKSTFKGILIGPKRFKNVISNYLRSPKNRSELIEQFVNADKTAWYRYK